MCLPFTSRPRCSGTPEAALRSPRAEPLPLLPFPSLQPALPGAMSVCLHCPLLARSLLPAPLPACPGTPAGNSSSPPKCRAESRPTSAARPTRTVPMGVSQGGRESAGARKWDVFGQQLHSALVRAEAALCGCLILNVMTNQTLIYCCPQA